MTTYRFNIDVKTHNANDVLSEDEMEEIVNHLLEITQWVEVAGITYGN